MENKPLSLDLLTPNTGHFDECGVCHGGELARVH